MGSTLKRGFMFTAFILSFVSLNPAVASTDTHYEIRNPSQLAMKVRLALLMGYSAPTQYLLVIGRYGGREIQKAEFDAIEIERFLNFRSKDKPYRVSTLSVQYRAEIYLVLSLSDVNSGRTMGPLMSAPQMSFLRKNLRNQMGGDRFSLDPQLRQMLEAALSTPVEFLEFVSQGIG